MTPALRTAYADPGDSTGLMLWRVTNSWQRAIRAALAPYDLTHVQFVLLAVLASVEDDATVMQRDLAARAGTDPMMTLQVIQLSNVNGSLPAILIRTTVGLAC